MKKILANVSKWLTTNKPLSYVIAGAFVLFMVNLKQCNSARKDKLKLEVAEHNIAALQDSIRITKDREGKVEFDKLAVLTNSVQNLEKLNADLAAEVKTIKGTVNTIIKADVQFVDKPVPFVVKGELVDSVVRADFKFDTTYSPGNFRKLSGYTKFDLRTQVASGVKEVDITGARFKTGIKNLDKGKPEIFLSSDYPGFTVTELDGAVLDPKLFTPKRRTPLITMGLHVGFVPVTYDFMKQKTNINLTQVGAGIGFNINLFRK